MTKEELFEVIGDTDEKKVASAVKPKKRVWLRWTALAACVCLIIAASVIMFPRKHSEDDNFTIITSEKGIVSGGGFAINSVYTAPMPGEYYCHTEVYLAREYYRGQNVKFLLRFHLSYGVSTEPDITDEDYEAEYKRLEEAGYELYEVDYWTYEGEGEKKPLKTVALLLTEEQIADFNINPKYGYAFDFITNGDGSAVIPGDETVISYHNSTNDFVIQ